MLLVLFEIIDIFLPYFLYPFYLPDFEDMRAELFTFCGVEN